MQSATGQRPIANVSTARRDGAGIIKAVGCRERCDLGHGLEGRASSSGQLGDIRRDPPRLIFREQLGRRSPAGLVLEVDIGELLTVVIAHHKAGRLFFDLPRRREAAIAAIKLRSSQGRLRRSL